MEVAQGENGGKWLPHQNVVKELYLLGQHHGGEQTFALPDPKDGILETATLVQAGVGGPVMSACRL